MNATKTKAEAKKAKEIEADLPHFYGSQTFTRWSSITKSVLSEGALYLAEKAQAFWLFDYIDSNTIGLNEGAVQTVVTVDKNHTAKIVLDDMNGHVLVSERIPSTSFPLDTITIWSMRNEHNALTHMLPSEY